MRHNLPLYLYLLYCNYSELATRSVRDFQWNAKEKLGSAIFATGKPGFTVQYVCDLLTRLGLYYLRRSLSNVQMTERKVSCVLSSYAAYGSCAATHWWELAACTSRLSSAISNCILYA